MHVEVIIRSEESEAVNSRLYFTTLFHIQHHMFSNIVFVAEIVREYLIFTIRLFVRQFLVDFYLLEYFFYTNSTVMRENLLRPQDCLTKQR